MLPSLKFLYKNYKGEILWREVKDPKIVYRYDRYHSKNKNEQVWIMEAFDIEKDDFRSFYLQDVIQFMNKEEY